MEGNLLENRYKAFGMSPTQRSLKKLRAEGWLCEITERWNPWAKRRIDLFGFVDILCLKADETLAVQTTTGSNLSARVQKIRDTQAAAVWLESPNRNIVVHGWRKVGARGKRKVWECKEMRLANFSGVMRVAPDPTPHLKI